MSTSAAFTLCGGYFLSMLQAGFDPIWTVEGTFEGFSSISTNRFSFIVFDKIF